MSQTSDTKILKRNISASFLIKGLALVVAFFSTPAYLAFFSDDSILGMWFTILGILTWIIFFDFGVGNGLRNHLSRCFVKKDFRQAQCYISSAYCIMGIFLFLVAVVFFFIADWVNWNEVFQIKSDQVSSGELVLVMRIVVTGTLLQLWFKLINSVLYAEQKTAIPSFAVLVTNALVLLSLLLPVQLSVNDRLLYVAIAQVASMNIPLLGISAFYYGKHNWMRLRVDMVKAVFARQVFSLGGLFFLIQLELLVVSSTNEILITLFADSSDVVGYTIYFRLFNLFVTVYALIVQPLWSSMASAYHDGRFAWLRKTHKGSVLVACVGSIACFATVPFLQVLFDVWLGAEAIKAENAAAIIFAMLTSCMLIINASTCIANATNRLKAQLFGFGIGALAKIPLSYYLVGLFASWTGVVAANMICLLPVAIAQTISSFLWLRKQKG